MIPTLAWPMLLGAPAAALLVLLVLRGRARRQRRRLAAALPAWGDALGLSHRPGRRPGSLGELNGILRDRRVLIRPDLSTLFVEHPRRIVGLHLATRAPRTPEPGAPTLGRAGDRLFRTRRFPRPFAAALTAPGGFLEQALRLRRTWGARLAELECGERELRARLRGGGLFPGRAWVKTDTFEALLRALLELSHALEGALREEAARQDAGR